MKLILKVMFDLLVPLTHSLSGLWASAWACCWVLKDFTWHKQKQSSFFEIVWSSKLTPTLSAATNAFDQTWLEQTKQTKAEWWLTLHWCFGLTNGAEIWVLAIVAPRTVPRFNISIIRPVRSLLLASIWLFTVLLRSKSGAGFGLLQRAFDFWCHCNKDNKRFHLKSTLHLLVNLQVHTGQNWKQSQQKWQ